MHLIPGRSGKPSVRRTQVGASSERSTATPSAMGTAMTRASSDETTVP